MAAESHKELQKCQDFGGWVRKDIQYSQFQNYELTYGHFVRLPSWGHWPPGSSPGRIRTTRTSSTTSTSSHSRPSTTFDRKKKSHVTTLPFFDLLLNFILFFPIHPFSSFRTTNSANPLRKVWISLDELILSLIHVKLNLFRLIKNNIRSRLLSSKWNGKISWLTTTAHQQQQQQQQQQISRFLENFLFFSLAIS